MAKITLWDWTTSHGKASKELITEAYAAASSKGKTINFNYLVWNEMVKYVKQIVDTSGIGWYSDSEFLTYSNTLMTNTEDGKILTAQRFNSVMRQLDWHKWSWWRDETHPGYLPEARYFYGKETHDKNADVVYGSYLLELMSAANTIATVLNGDGPQFKGLDAFKINSIAKMELFNKYSYLSAGFNIKDANYGHANADSTGTKIKSSNNIFDVNIDEAKLTIDYPKVELSASHTFSVDNVKAHAQFIVPDYLKSKVDNISVSNDESHIYVFNGYANLKQKDDQLINIGWYNNLDVFGFVGLDAKSEERFYVNWNIPKLNPLPIHHIKSIADPVQVNNDTPNLETRVLKHLIYKGENFKVSHNAPKINILTFRKLKSKDVDNIIINGVAYNLKSLGFVKVKQDKTEIITENNNSPKVHSLQFVCVKQNDDNDISLNSSTPCVTSLGLVETSASQNPELIQVNTNKTNLQIRETKELPSAKSVWIQENDKSKATYIEWNDLSSTNNYISEDDRSRLIASNDKYISGSDNIKEVSYSELMLPEVKRYKATNVEEFDDYAKVDIHGPIQLKGGTSFYDVASGKITFPQIQRLSASQFISINNKALLETMNRNVELSINHQIQDLSKSSIAKLTDIDISSEDGFIVSNSNPVMTLDEKYIHLSGSDTFKESDYSSLDTESWREVYISATTAIEPVIFNTNLITIPYVQMSCGEYESVNMKGALSLSGNVTIYYGTLYNKSFEHTSEFTISEVVSPGVLKTNGFHYDYDLTLKRYYPGFAYPKELGKLVYIYDYDNVSYNLLESWNLVEDGDYYIYSSSHSIWDDEEFVPIHYLWHSPS